MTYPGRSYADQNRRRQRLAKTQPRQAMDEHQKREQRRARHAEAASATPPGTRTFHRQTARAIRSGALTHA